MNNKLISAIAITKWIVPHRRGVENGDFCIYNLQTIKIDFFSNLAIPSFYSLKRVMPLFAMQNMTCFFFPGKIDIFYYGSNVLEPNVMRLPFHLFPITITIRKGKGVFLSEYIR